MTEKELLLELAEATKQLRTAQQVYMRVRNKSEYVNSYRELLGARVGEIAKKVDQVLDSDEMTKFLEEDRKSQ